MSRIVRRSQLSGAPTRRRRAARLDHTVTRDEYYRRRPTPPAAATLEDQPYPRVDPDASFTLAGQYLDGHFDTS